MFLPDLDPTWKINTSDHVTLQRLEERLPGGLLMARSLGEVLHDAGKMLAASGVGSTGNTFLHHHKAEALGGVIVHPAMTIPASESGELVKRFGPWPEQDVPNDARIERAVTVLLEHLIPVYQPAVATLWMSDPDSAQHKCRLGSAVAMESIRLADAQLGRILERMAGMGMAEATDVIVLSDHGHSTVTQRIDVARFLIEAGVKESETSLDVLVAANGGCDAIYAHDHGRRRVRAIVEALMPQPWCGPIFTRETTPPVSGTFPMSLISHQNERSPDILMSFAWSSDRNLHGVSGACPASGVGPAGWGQHGSTSPYDIHNALVAAGPHFKEGITSPIPSCNVDVLPTVLHILGLVPPDSTDGRVLSEAFKWTPPPEEGLVSTELHTASATNGGVTYQQEVQLSGVGGTVYLDEASASRG